jgi:hypothetical protein
MKAAGFKLSKDKGWNFETGAAHFKDVHPGIFDPNAIHLARYKIVNEPRVDARAGVIQATPQEIKFNKDFWKEAQHG